MHFIPLVMGKFCTNMLKTLGLSLRKPKMQRIEITALKRSPEIAANHLIMVVLHEEHLAIREVLQIVNTASMPYRGAGGESGSPPVSLYLPLPQGYSNLSGIEGLAADHIRIDAAGVFYIAPLAPGAHRIMYTYTLPL